MGKKISILGGRGMLGSDIARLCEERGIESQTYDLPDFDISDAEQVKAVVADSQAVINCAAYTDVERAENDKDKAFAINSGAVGQLGEIAKKAGVWVLHFGTDFVFDGRLDRPYRETDAANPLSVYGKSKYDGEVQLAQSGCEHCTVRIEWTYGVSGNNFIRKIISVAQSRSEIKIVDDQVGSPTATSEIAKAALQLGNMRTAGLFHFAAREYVSRYEMAKLVFGQLGIKTSVIPCKSDEFKTAAVRPLNSRFDCSKIEGVLGGAIEPWQGPLKKFLEKL